MSHLHGASHPLTTDIGHFPECVFVSFGDYSALISLSFESLFIVASLAAAYLKIRFSQHLMEIIPAIQTQSVAQSAQSASDRKHTLLNTHTLNHSESTMWAQLSTTTEGKLSSAKTIRLHIQKKLGTTKRLPGNAA